MKTRSTLLLLPCALFLVPLSAHAGIYGDTLTASTDTPYSITPGSAVAGVGVEFSFREPLAGPTPIVATIDFSQTDLIFTVTKNASFTASPRLLNFTDTTNAFTTASFVSSTVSGFSASNVSFSGGTLTLDLESTTLAVGNTIDVSFAPVPEPGQYGLAVFLSVLAFFGWKRFSLRAV